MWMAQAGTVRSCGRAWLSLVLEPCTHIGACDCIFCSSRLWIEPARSANELVIDYEVVHVALRYGRVDAVLLSDELREQGIIIELDLIRERQVDLILCTLCHGLRQRRF